MRVILRMDSPGSLLSTDSRPSSCSNMLDALEIVNTKSEIKPWRRFPFDFTLTNFSPTSSRQSQHGIQGGRG